MVTSVPFIVCFVRDFLFPCVCVFWVGVAIELFLTSAKGNIYKG